MTNKLLTEEQKDLLTSLAYKKSSEIENYVDLFQDNMSMLARLVKINGLLLKYASTELKQNSDIVDIAIKQNHDSLEFAHDKYKNDKQFIENLMTTNQSLFKYASPILQDDKQYVLHLLSIPKNNSIGTLFRYVSDRLKEDREVVTKAVEIKGGNLKFVSEKYKDDNDIVAIAVNDNGYAIRHASTRLKDNKNIAWLACSNRYGTSIDELSLRLKDDKELVLHAMLFNPSSFQYASERLRGDADIVELAVRKEPKSFKYVADSYKNDLSFIIRQLQNLDPDTNNSYNEEEDEYDDKKLIDRNFIFNNLSTDFKNDINKMTCLVSFDNSCVRYASESLLNSEQFALVVVSHEGENLHYLSEDLKKNRYIVMSAVLNNPYALQYTSEEYKNDLDIVRLAVTNKKNGGSFQYASEDIKSNKDFVEYALGISSDNMQHISEKLANDKQFIIHCMEKFKNIKILHNIFVCLNTQMRSDLDIIKLGLEKNYRNYTFIAEEKKETLDVFILLLQATNNDNYISQHMTAKMKEDFSFPNYREYVEKAMNVKRLDEKYPLKEDKTKKIKL